MKAVCEYIRISYLKILLDSWLRITLYFWDWLPLASLQLRICHLERIQNSHSDNICRTVSFHILHIESKGIQFTSESKLVSPIVVWELNKCNKQWSVRSYWLWLGRCCLKRCNRLMIHQNHNRLVLENYLIHIFDLALISSSNKALLLLVVHLLLYIYMFESMYYSRKWSLFLILVK